MASNPARLSILFMRFVVGRLKRMGRSVDGLSILFMRFFKVVS